MREALPFIDELIARNAEAMIEQVRSRLTSGNISRDDAYRSVVRWAAKAGVDRYKLWQSVVAPQEGD